MSSRIFALTVIIAAIAAAPLAASAQETKKESENFFDITDEVKEAGNVVESGAKKTVGFFEGLFDDGKDDDLKFNAPWEKKN
jgi:hypothetical protein